MLKSRRRTMSITSVAVVAMLASGLIATAQSTANTKLPSEMKPLLPLIGGVWQSPRDPARKSGSPADMQFEWELEQHAVRTRGFGHIDYRNGPWKQTTSGLIGWDTDLKAFRFWTVDRRIGITHGTLKAQPKRVFQLDFVRTVKAVPKAFRYTWKLIDEDTLEERAWNQIDGVWKPADQAQTMTRKR